MSSVPAFLRAVMLLFSVAATTLFLFSCGGAQPSAWAVEGDTLVMRHSSLLTLVECDSFTVVDVRNPWRKGAVQRYVLVSKSAAVPAGLPEGVLLRTPLDNALLFSSVHVNLFDALGCMDAVRGVCDAKYMLLPEVKSRINAGEIVDCGSSLNINAEQAFSLSPDAIFVLPFENGGNGKVEKMGFPVVGCVEYMENSPLGAAEWMRFYGRLLGRGATADSLFSSVCDNFEKLVSISANAEHRPKLMCGLKGGSAWYVPAGESTMGQMYKAAGADYLFADGKGSGSLPLSYETMLNKAMDADVWLFKYNAPESKTLSALAGDFAGYSNFRPFRNGCVYGCNTAVKRFYEETPFRPDLLLKELLAIFHPALVPGYKLRYYEKIEE